MAGVITWSDSPLRNLVCLAARQSLLGWPGQHHSFTAQTRFGLTDASTRHSLQLAANKTHCLSETSWFWAIDFYHRHMEVLKCPCSVDDSSCNEADYG